MFKLMDSGKSFHLKKGEALLFVTEGTNPQRVSTEIIIEIKEFNPGQMASHASIESIWCTH